MLSQILQHKIAILILIGSIVLFLFLLRSPHSLWARIPSGIFLVIMILFLWGSTMDKAPIASVDLAKETTESIAKIMTVGQSTQEDVRKLFGDPKYRLDPPVNCNPADYVESARNYICDQNWIYEKTKTPYVWIRAKLSVYFKSDGTVSAYKLTDEY